MAKKTKKLGRPRKKRKYTKVVEKNGWASEIKVPLEQTNIKDVVNQASASPIRASDSSYVFICGNKVLIRNLTDEMLNERYEQTFISHAEARRQANNLESLEFNLSMEQRYRGLK